MRRGPESTPRPSGEPDPNLRPDGETINNPEADFDTKVSDMLDDVYASDFNGEARLESLVEGYNNLREYVESNGGLGNLDESVARRVLRFSQQMQAATNNRDVFDQTFSRSGNQQNGAPEPNLRPNGSPEPNLNPDDSPEPNLGPDNDPGHAIVRVDNTRDLGAPIERNLPPDGNDEAGDDRNRQDSHDEPEPANGGPGGPNRPNDHDHQEESPEDGEGGRRSLDQVMNQGHTAMILALHNKDDQENVLREALAIKAQNVSREHFLMTRIPFFGKVIRAAMVARGTKQARQAAYEGDYAKVYSELGLSEADMRKSTILKTTSGSAEQQAWNTLEGAGYTDDNRINKVVGRYDTNDKVEKLDEATSNNAKEALNNYFERLKNGEDAATLDQEFDEEVKGLFNGEDASMAYSLREQRDRLKDLANDYSLNEIQEYVNGRTLYRAQKFEGPYTEQKVEGLVKATVAAGIAGAIAYTLISREAQKGARTAATPLTGAAVGAVTGGVFGAVSGWGRARQRLAENELHQATTFDNPEAATTELARADADANAEGAENAPAADAEANNPATAEGQTEQLSPEQLAAMQQNAANQGGRGGLFGTVMKGLGALNRAKSKYLYGEQKYFDQIEQLRDRKDAGELMEQMDALLEANANGDQATRDQLEAMYVDIMARGRVSRDKRIDLVKFDKNRGEFDQKLREVERSLYGDRGNLNEQLPEEFVDGLQEKIAGRQNELLENFNKAEWVRRRYQLRAATVDGIIAAGMAAGAGALIQIGTNALRDAATAMGLTGEAQPGNGGNNVDDLMNQAKAEGKGVTLEEDPDGGYALKIGDQTLIGEGDQPGINYNPDGSLNNESREALEALGLTINETVGSRPAPGGGSTFQSLEDFFNRGNAGTNGLTTISGRDWSADDPVVIYDPVADGEGNIVMQVVPSGYQGNIDDLTMFLSPGKSGMTALALDVQPDGTVVIPAGSPASSLFNGDDLLGRVEVGTMQGDGIAHILAVDGPGTAVGQGINVAVPNDLTEIPTYSYSISTADGTTLDLATPDIVNQIAEQTAIHEGMPTIGLDEPNGLNFTGETVTMHTADGQTIELERATHFGGYQSITDTFNSPEKRGSGNTGTSIIDTLLERHTGAKTTGRSIEDVDAQFSEMVRSGEISQSEVVNEWLKTCTNSPESIVSFRSYMGGLTADLGNGQVTIDTEEEINNLADMISRDPVAYDNFVNDTLNMFYDRINGGTISLSNLLENQYQYTTWDQLFGDNIFQHLGHINTDTTNGVGLVFLDQNGETIYDQETIHSILNIPGNFRIDEVGPRLDCGGQIYVRVSALQEEVEDMAATTPKHRPTSTTTNVSAEDETTEPGKTGTSENSGVEPTGDEPTGDEPTGTEPTGEEPTGVEPTGDEPTGEEPTGVEPTGAEPTGTEPTGDEPTGVEPTGDEPTGEENIGKGPVDITTGDSGFAPDVTTGQPEHPDNMPEGTPGNQGADNIPDSSVVDTPAGNVQTPPSGGGGVEPDTDFSSGTSTWDGGQSSPGVGIDQGPEPAPDTSQDVTYGEYQDPGDGIRF